MFSDEKDSKVIKFGNAIRFGSIDIIMKMLENNGIDIITNGKVKFEISLLPQKGNFKPVKSDIICMSLFHLAIIAKQANIVKAILQFIMNCVCPNDEIGQMKILKKILSDTTKITFSNGISDEYLNDDCILDGINAIHLAARFHVQSLFEIVNLLRGNDVLHILKDIVREHS